MAIFLSRKAALLSDDEQAALRAVARESNASRLQLAANSAGSYRVRSAASSKLGWHQKAAYETALHDPDAGVCLAALDAVSWDTGESLLTDIASFSEHEEVALRALDMISDEEQTVLAAVRTKSENVALAAVGKLRKDRHLSEVASRASSPRVILEAIRGIQNPKTVYSLFRGSSRLTELAERCGGEKFVSARITGELEALCCPDGRFHDFEEKKEWIDRGYSDDDDMKARKGYYRVTKTCRNCGYTTD